MCDSSQIQRGVIIHEINDVDFFPNRRQRDMGLGRPAKIKNQQDF